MPRRTLIVSSPLFWQAPGRLYRLRLLTSSALTYHKKPKPNLKFTHLSRAWP